MKQILTLIGTMLLFTACHKEHKPDFSEQAATRAVLIYMAGENNLTASSGIRYLQNDLREIIDGSKYLTDQQRLFVFVDSLGTNSTQKGMPYIMEVHGGKIYERYQYDKDFYSSDPEQLRNAVNWMTQHVKADGYALVLWGHASGWVVESDTLQSPSRRAYGLDTGADTGVKQDRWMNITQIAEALHGLPTLDFIFADCCNMMCAEVAYELRNTARYLIGSPAEIPGDGAPYDLMIPQLFKNDSQLYQGIIDTYYNYYIDAYTTSYPDLSGYSVPLAVVDTRYIDNLAQQTRNILSSIIPQSPEQVSLTGIPFYIGIDSPLMYDLQAVISQYASTSDYAQWLQAYQQAVPYRRMSMRWMTIYGSLLRAFPTFDTQLPCGCISMFFPLSNSDYLYGKYAYNSYANHFAWNRLMDWSRFGW